MPGPTLWAVSDLHVAGPDNRRFVEELAPFHPDDWMIVAGDVDEDLGRIEWTFDQLASRYAQVIWAPGNHELWTPWRDEGGLRGQARYDHLVALAQRYGIATPEDDYLDWVTDDGPLTVAPLHLLYDYSYDFVTPDTTKAERLRAAESRNIVCTDEYLLHPDPYSSIEEWCWARIDHTRARLDAIDPERRTVLVNHFPLKARLTRPLRYPDFALWCGTKLTSDWHLRYRAEVVVSGHLHIPRTLTIDDVRFEEVSLGHARERAKMPNRPPLPRSIATRAS